MNRLNFNHLRCFWAVARDGSIARACETLGLSQPTISKQIIDLEDSFDQPLFHRSGRRLLLTELGRTVYAYADDIFSLGQELLQAVDGQATDKPLRLHIGVSDAVPKLLTRLVIEPALAVEQPVRVVCREGKTDRLLADLAISALDVVITDAPLAVGERVRAHSHRLGESAVGLFGRPELAARVAEGFPKSLASVPLLLPTENTAMRQSVDRWLQKRRVVPWVLGEFEDSALLKAFGEAGHGLFFAPLAVESQIVEHFGVERVAIAEGVREAVYAVTADRRITHPGVAAVIGTARETLAV